MDGPVQALHLPLHGVQQTKPLLRGVQQAVPLCKPVQTVGDDRGQHLVGRVQETHWAVSCEDAVDVSEEMCSKFCLNCVFS